MTTKERFALLSNKYIRQDGWKHIYVSIIICLVLAWLPCFLPPIIALAIGVAKEVYDKKTGKGTAEMHDLACDGVGVFIGFWGVILIQVLIKALNWI